jgi:proline iminopeptidase
VGDAEVVDPVLPLLERGDEQAARRWCEWEETAVGLGPQARYQDGRFRMAFARIVTAYFSNQAWLADGELLAGAQRLRDIPGVLIHGRLDIASPLLTAWELAQAWPAADLVVVDGEGHAGELMASRVLEATARFAVRENA